MFHALYFITVQQGLAMRISDNLRPLFAREIFSLPAFFPGSVLV